MCSGDRNAKAVPYCGTYRVGVIGHTGCGGYSHSIDRAFLNLPGVHIVAVADPDSEGRKKARARMGAAREYAHYRDMLEREQLDAVAVAPAWLDQREAMMVAAAQSGAKAIYCEKPIACSLDQADRMLAACEDNGVRIAVAHQNRVFPAPQIAMHLIKNGKIGRLRTIRAYTKQDSRAGGLELLIHGTHLFDLMRFFAGDSLWCSARITLPGRDITAADVDASNPAWGLMAGDDIVAEFGFNHGVIGIMESVRYDNGGDSRYLGWELYGTNGVLVFRSSILSPVYYHPHPQLFPEDADKWEVISSAGEAHIDAEIPPQDRLHIANQALVCDLLHAVERGRQPVSSGYDARAALEMIMAVYESQIQQNRVLLPLERRTHPLQTWLDRSKGAHR